MPVSVSRLRELIALAAARGVEGVDVIEDGTHIVISRNGVAPVDVSTQAVAVPVMAEAAPELFLAPMFGVFHVTPGPGMKPFVAAGDLVIRGQTLCLIEAMKTFNEVASDRDGLLVEILATPGIEIARGQALFRIAKA